MTNDFESWHESCIKQSNIIELKIVLLSSKINGSVHSDSDESITIYFCYVLAIEIILKTWEIQK